MRLCCMQMFVRAVEEAKEVHDTRQGITPATNHEPWDFLLPNPRLVDSDDDLDADRDAGGKRGAGKLDLRPPEAEAKHAQRCNAHEALRWLHLLAQGRSVAKVSSDFHHVSFAFPS